MKWINVKDRLPESYKNVLAFDDGRIWIGTFNINLGYIDDEFLPLKATHWMPLPKPPKDNE